MKSPAQVMDNKVLTRPTSSSFSNVKSPAQVMDNRVPCKGKVSSLEQVVQETRSRKAEEAIITRKKCEGWHLEIDTNQRVGQPKVFLKKASWDMDLDKDPIQGFKAAFS